MVIRCRLFAGLAIALMLAACASEDDGLATSRTKPRPTGTGATVTAPSPIGPDLDFQAFVAGLGEKLAGRGEIKSYNDDRLLTATPIAALDRGEWRLVVMRGESHVHALPEGSFKDSKSTTRTWSFVDTADGSAVVVMLDLALHNHSADTVAALREYIDSLR